MSKTETDNSSFRDKVLYNLKFTPTNDQISVANHLSAFTTSTKHNPVYVLKGYAGTGKTSMISAYVNTLKEYGKYFVLLAPTGRAAKVLTQYTTYKAHTIHRYIYVFMTNKDGLTNIVLSHNKLRNAVFIVDESSMIGDSSQANNSIFSRNSLLDDLFQYVFSQKGNKLILVGDTAQLPPVGINLSPALDIENLRASYSITSFDFEMKEVMRQTFDSGILTSATNLRNKIENNDLNLPFYKLNNSANDITVINDAGNFGDLLMESFTDSDSDNGIIVCRSNKQANIYNQQIRNRILMRDSEIETGDLLMVVKNNYFWLDKESVAGFIANGDIIKITRFKKIEDLYGFHFADVDIQLIDYPDEKELNVKLLLDTISANSPGLSDEDSKRLYSSVEEDYMNYSNRRTRLNKIKANVYYNALHVKFSYAMTCHKTQGGQWKNVFIDKGYIPENKYDIEYLRWLYTATTRATDKLNLVGFDENYFDFTMNENI